MKVISYSLLFMLCSFFGYGQNYWKPTFTIGFQPASATMAWYHRDAGFFRNHQDYGLGGDVGLDFSFDLNQSENPWKINFGMMALFNYIRYEPYTQRIEFDESTGITYLYGPLKYTYQWFAGLTMGFKKDISSNTKSKWKFSITLRDAIMFGFRQEKCEYIFGDYVVNGIPDSQDRLLNQLQMSFGAKYMVGKERFRFVEFYVPVNYYYRNSSYQNHFFNAGVLGFRFGV